MAEDSDVSKKGIKEEAEKPKDTKKTPKPKDSGASKSSIVLMNIMFSLAFGFIGGWIALETIKSPVDVDYATGEKVVLSENQLTADIAERVSPSVVSILVTSQQQTSFFGETAQQQSAGTGIILSDDGMIVTNKHVIPESANSVSIKLSDGTVYDEVKVLGRDPFNDIAFLKIEGAEDLKPAKLGDSDKMRVGDKVIAIGNALGEFDTTVTQGIISGKGRPLVAGSSADAEQLINLFQTDAAINPGNSGGPLVNVNGEVIGINTAKASGDNIGFSIPINDVKPGISSVEKNGKLVKPYLGIVYTMINKEIASQENLPTEKGALIISPQNGGPSVLPGSPADDAGLRMGDIITKINGEELDQDSIVGVIQKYQVGDEIELEYIRGDETKTVKVKLEEAPSDIN